MRPFRKRAGRVSAYRALVGLANGMIKTRPRYHHDNHGVGNKHAILSVNIRVAVFWRKRAALLQGAQAAV